MRLLSWNVQWCRGIDGRVDPARIAAEARRLADPDVLCLQEIAVNYPEMPGSEGEDQVELLSREFPGYRAFFACGVDLPGKGRRRQFGNLLLSRLPVGRVRRHSLPWPPSPDTYSMPRVAVEAVIDAAFGALRVLTTHLEYYLVEHRAAQIGRLRAIHAEACSDRLAVDEPGSYETVPPLPQSAIICGDFNMKPEDPLHALMRHAGFDDAWDALNAATAARQPTFHVHDGEPPYCCDYVFVSEDLLPRLRSIRIDAATQASDHQPVILELADD